MSHPNKKGITEKRGCTATHKSDYREISWRIDTWIDAKLCIYSEYFLGGLTERLRVDLVGGDAGGGAASAQLSAPTTRRRFIRIFPAMCKAFRLAFLVVSWDFYKVAASSCCFLSARAADSSLARAFFASSGVLAIAGAGD